MKKFFRLAILAPVDRFFTYSADCDLVAGTLVLVPFGAKNNPTFAVILSEENSTDHLDNLRGTLIQEDFVKSVLDVVYVGIVSENLLHLAMFLADYNAEILGNILRLCLPLQSYKHTPKKPVKYIELSDISPPSDHPLMPQINQLKEILNLHGKITLKNAKEILPAKFLTKFLKEGFIKEISANMEPPANNLPQLNFDQATTFSAILQDFVGKFHVTLLEGVTGSGKTEIYINLIENILKNEGQVLVMFPEIALTGTIIERFKTALGFEIVPWNSLISDGLRRENFHKIAAGTARLVIGTRSSVMLPFKNLKAIIIDEEHDQSYKQDENIHYNARDAAIMRAKIENFPILLASATPSIESEVNALTAKYKKVMLQKRFFDVPLPRVNLINLRQDKCAKGSCISVILSEKIKQVIQDRKQVLLFVNRRGYAPIVICEGCGHKLKCPYCDVCLTEHRFDYSYRCHKCGFKDRHSKSCPKCQKALRTVGIGVEKVKEDIEKLFPNARSLIISSDTVTSPKKFKENIEQIDRGFVDIIIGTQIISKGFHFKNLTLVAILDADSGFFGEDFRGFERTYQLLTQVGGRAGRETGTGEVYIQTYEPQNPVLKAICNYDRDAFYLNEIKNRKQFKLPPFIRQVSLVISSKNSQDAKEYSLKFTEHLKKNITEMRDIEIFGPAPAPISYIRSRHRFRILINSARSTRVQPFLKQALLEVKIWGDLRVKIDVDPMNFY